jgi:hypothetical protein
MAYLEKCDSPEKVIAFLEKLEQAIIRQSQKTPNQERNKSEKPISAND